MGKIVYIMGKSSTGKDTIFKELIRGNKFPFKTLVTYTTRPKRSGEKEGYEYHFVTEDEYQSMEKEGKVIEARTYPSAMGPWRYFTVNDGQLDSDDTFITIGTLESYCSMKDYLKKNQLIPVLVELDDGVRLQRALNREKKQQTPGYEEMCRRFLADQKDFSEENIKKAGIIKRFTNNDLLKCLHEIEDYITRELENGC